MAYCGVVHQMKNLLVAVTEVVEVINPTNPTHLIVLIIHHVSVFDFQLQIDDVFMKKLLYPVIGLVIICLSFFNMGKKTEEKRIEEMGSDNLILRPFQFLGLLWSCSPDRSDEENIPLQDPTHYSELVDSVTNSGTHSSHYSGTHYSHSSQNHSSHYSGTHLSHYSSTHYSHSNHSSHYSGTHSSHYSGTHESHQSHSSHSSHYSAR